MSQAQSFEDAERRWVFRFGKGRVDGSASMRKLLGMKGANLAEMSALGLPVPPGFTISSALCSLFLGDGSLPPALKPMVAEALEDLGRAVGAKFGDAENPLLVSVRAGSRASIPGMFDTVLNLGLNDQTVEALARRSGDRRFAYDAYRRFIEMYAHAVDGLDHGLFEDTIDEFKREQGLDPNAELSAENLEAIAVRLKRLVETALGRPFPQDTQVQLWGAIAAVFRHWQSPRAVAYRKLHDIPDDWGTAVNIQAMVFGNRGNFSGTGLAITRSPQTGEKILQGEFLPNAQGDDVVARLRKPNPLTEAGREQAKEERPSFQTLMPGLFAELAEVCEQLEARYRDAQEVEFTVEEGKLWVLEARPAKRSPRAALRIAVALAREGLINEAEAVTRVDPSALDELLHPTLDPDAPKLVIAKGRPASPGAASGEIVLDPHEVEKLKAQGRTVILVRIETSPEDIHGMLAAKGIVTARGGVVSHAAVVARGMGLPCVTGAGALHIDYEGEVITAGAHTLKKGDVITINGSSGEIIKGRVPMREPELSGDFATLISWADQYRRMRVRANAETPRDARQAREFGAEGIGLCRTEQMLFGPDRILALREMILADDEQGRRGALAKLLPMQRDDLIELFEIMAGFPVTVRLFDAPLHEFLPHDEEEIAELAAAMDVGAFKVKRRLGVLRETNPMLGHRGCRLALTYPEIAEMQARAIFEAAIEAGRRTGHEVVPEIMVPLVASKAEIDMVKSRIDAVARTVEAERGLELEYRVGTMIELPRACLRAGAIAATAEFFSFGTNDLTQTTLGLSRDDAAGFLAAYTTKGILGQDPFATIDEGVAELIDMAVARGRATRPSLKLGICGEHGGDPATIDFCERIGLDYLSCSPFRVPVARLAAAQAALAKGKADQNH